VAVKAQSTHHVSFPVTSRKGPATDGESENVPSSALRVRARSGSEEAGLDWEVGSERLWLDRRRCCWAYLSPYCRRGSPCPYSPVFLFQTCEDLQFSHPNLFCSALALKLEVTSRSRVLLHRTLDIAEGEPRLTVTWPAKQMFEKRRRSTSLVNHSS